MARRRVQPRNLRIVIAALTALAVSAALLQHPGHSRGAGTGTQPSLNVAVIPGFTPPIYPGYHGVSAFPATAPQLSAYHFSQLAANQITASALASHDTAILYGIRWSDIPTSGQKALNTFAATHKVMIWDADGTGPQSYSSFIHPFSDQASGEENTNPHGSVVSFPTGEDFLASDQPSSPYYLDPNQLVNDRDEINHMSAMTTGTKNWVPALAAANSKIPQGGWPLAWSYGVIGNHTGMTIFSGIDADAFGNNQLNPNNAIKELALQLQAQFRQTPDPSCAPGCTLPSPGGGPPHAACSITKASTHWVHGRVPVWLKTSVAGGITGRVLSPSGRVIASGVEQGDTIHFRVKTRPLRSNHTSRLQAQIFVNGQQACSTSFKLKVDNTPPRLLYLAALRLGSVHQARLKLSEKSTMTVTGPHVPHRPSVLIAAHKLIDVRLPTSVRRARLTLRDRAGNVVVRKLIW